MVLVTWVDALLADATQAHALREAYAPFAFGAVIAGAFFGLQRLGEQHAVGLAAAPALAATTVAMLVRWMRYDSGTPTGKGALLCVSMLIDKGGLEISSDGRLALTAKMPRAMEAVARELVSIYTTGDYPRAAKLLERFGSATPALKKLAEQVRDVPIDVDPILVSN